MHSRALAEVADARIHDLRKQAEVGRRARRIRRKASRERSPLAALEELVLARRATAALDGNHSPSPRRI